MHKFTSLAHASMEHNHQEEEMLQSFHMLEQVVALKLLENRGEFLYLCAMLHQLGTVAASFRHDLIISASFEQASRQSSIACNDRTG